MRLISILFAVLLFSACIFEPESEITYSVNGEWITHDLTIWVDSSHVSEEYDGRQTGRLFFGKYSCNYQCAQNKTIMLICEYSNILMHRDGYENRAHIWVD